MAEPLTLGIAFVGGVLSFVSPCVLPLIPAYISHLSGTSVEELQQKNSLKMRMRVFGNASFFVIGFTSVFILAGIALVSVAQLFPELQAWFLRIAGAIIILFGLQTMGLINLPFFGRQHQFRIQSERRGMANSAVLGAAFGAGWTPCVGPILAAIFGISLATGSVSDSAGLLTAYSIGLGIPFLIAGLFTGFVSKIIQRVNTYGRIVDMIAGVLIISLGIVIFTNSFAKLLALTVEVFPFLRMFFLG